MRDPIWWLFKLATLVPVYGVRVVLHAILLVMLTLPSSQMDEFQLVQFVLGFKGTQFISGGLLLALQGGVTLFTLTTLEEPGSVEALLASEAPGVGEGLLLEAVDLVGSVVLGWIALASLPCSHKHGVKETMATTAQSQAVEEKKRGGRLGGMLRFDVAMFALSAVCFALLLALSGFTAEDWQASACLFWVRVLYSLTTAPFFFFTLPIFSTVLTHAKPTGFNRFGRCVPFRRPPKAVESTGGGSPCDLVNDDCLHETTFVPAPDLETGADHHQRNPKSMRDDASHSLCIEDLER